MTVEINHSAKILLFAKKDVQSAFVISACFINQIPVVILSADKTEMKLNHRINGTGAYYCFDLNLDTVQGLSLPRIKIPELTNGYNDSAEFSIPIFDESKLFSILFTSGTTSDAKAVPLYFKHILSAATSSSTNLPLDSTDEWLLNLPLHHIGGISVLIRCILAGAKVYLNPVSDTDSLLEIFLNRNTLTHASLVPTQLKRLMDNTNFRVGPHFKAILLGGGPISPSIHRLAKDRNIPVIPSYGMTETAAQCIAVPYLSWKNTPDGTSGKPLPDIMISLRKDDSNNESTLLWVKGNQVFDGYIDEGYNTNSFDDDGWFNTGDYARLDQSGYVFIEMRRADRIVTGGENVNPLVLEDVLESYESVVEAGVFGILDDEWGQAVHAAIVLNHKDEALNEDNLRDFLKSRVPNYMIPKQILVVQQLPRTPSGKLIRSELIKLKKGSV